MSRLQQIRPFITRETALCKVPRAWLERIEQRIVRWKNPETHGDCWFWTGAVAGNGEPKLAIVNERKIGTVSLKSRSDQLAKIFVAAIFWDWGDDAYAEVIHTCGQLTCLQPRHLQVSFQHPAHRDWDDILARTKDRSLRIATSTEFF